MKTLHRLLNKLGNRLTISAKSFPITLLYLLAISAYASYLLFAESFDIDQQFIVMSLILGTLSSLLISLYNKGKYYLNIIVSIVLTICSYIFLKDDVYHYLFILAMALLLIAGIVFLLFKDDHEGKLFAYLICEAVYCLVLCTILFAGICIILAAIEYLIYEIDDFYKLVFSTFFIIYVFVCFGLFISSFEYKDKTIQVNNVYKTIIHKAALILYYILLVVLYIYLVKILFTLKMPVGQLNWFASIALLFNAFFYISGQFDDENKLVKFHKKYGGIVLIPIFIIQSVAIYIRISAYGLTSMRCLSIAYNIFGLSFIVSSIIKKKKFIYLVFTILVLVIFVSPINIIDAPVYNQEKILEKVLVKNDMLQGDNIIPKENISTEDKETIRSVYYYLIGSESNKIKYDFKDTLFETFGFDISSSDNYCYYYASENFNFEIENYKNVEVFDEYSEDCLVYGIDISDELLNIYETYGSNGVLVGNNQSYNADSDEPHFSFSIDIDENNKLIFDHLNYSIIDNKIAYVSCHGYKLSK